MYQRPWLEPFQNSNSGRVTASITRKMRTIVRLARSRGLSRATILRKIRMIVIRRQPEGLIERENRWFTWGFWSPRRNSWGVVCRRALVDTQFPNNVVIRDAPRHWSHIGGACRRLSADIASSSWHLLALSRPCSPLLSITHPGLHVLALPCTCTRFPFTR